MAKGRATRDASTDESCNGIRKQRRKKETKQNHQTMESSSNYEREHRSQITKNQILKTKTSRTIDGRPTTRKTTSKRTKL
ncbi:hypothetical protein F2Q69_00022071 [Brassica cretica]|uniref:Uncharacterized protein n=1 Tax=Brassica cretica TaxID=69181 RepID=A0A8S9QES2_BRACR|nr:hypothetical protein F2Q69_00022071 [Brassica cretica]